MSDRNSWGSRADDFGPPLDSRSKFAKSDWQVFAAGAAKSGSRARDFFVESVVKYTKASKNNVHGDLFLSDTGWSVGFKTRWGPLDWIVSISICVYGETERGCQR